MAQVKVDSVVMRDKAKTIETQANTIRSQYDDMLREVNSMASKMSGTTIETAKNEFAAMKTRFDTIVEDMKKYSAFLSNAADHYEEVEWINTQRAQEQG